MASENKKAKTDKRNHWGRGGNWLKKGTKFRRVSIYTGADRAALEAAARRSAKEVER